MKKLVVARHKENTDWVKDVPTPWKVELIQKQIEGVKGDMPNVGREPTSFLFAMYRDYLDIKDNDTYAFVQGNPFDHAPDLFEQLNKRFTKFDFLGKGTMMSKGNGAPHHTGLNLREKYMYWLNEPFPGEVRFSPGGQFIVRGKQIKQYPRDVYAFLIDEATEGQTPYILERMWFSLFN